MMCRRTHPVGATLVVARPHPTVARPRRCGCPVAGAHGGAPTHRSVAGAHAGRPTRRSWNRCGPPPQRMMHAAGPHPVGATLVVARSPQGQPLWLPGPVVSRCTAGATLVVARSGGRPVHRRGNPCGCPVCPVRRRGNPCGCPVVVSRCAVGATLVVARSRWGQPLWLPVGATLVVLVVSRCGATLVVARSGGFPAAVGATLVVARSGGRPVAVGATLVVARST